MPIDVKGFASRTSLREAGASNHRFTAKRSPTAFAEAHASA